MNEKELREFRARFDIPIRDEDVVETPFYRPPKDSPEIKYLLERRRKLGGFVPKRVVKAEAVAHAAGGGIRGVFEGIGRGRTFDDDGFCAAFEQPAAGQNHWAARGADHTGRGADLWHRRVVYRGGHLFLARASFTSRWTNKE